MIKKRGRLYSVAKGEVILSTEEGKSIQMVKEGYIKRYQITSSGNISVQSIYGPGIIFPLTYVFKLLFDKDIYSGPDVYYYEAMCKASLYSLEGSQLKELVNDNPILYKDLMMAAAERFQSNIHQLENISLSVYYKRVAHQLWYFARCYSKPSGRGVKILIPLTQQDLADVLSTTRETVSLCMTQLKKEGLIKTGKFIMVPNVKRLEEEAYS